MPDLLIPKSIDEITSEWLTEALRSTDTIRGVVVKSFDAEVIGVGQGFTGQIAKLRLEYDSDEEGPPASLVAKLPPADPDLRTFVNGLGVYERETRFYEEIADKIELRTPQRYYSATNADIGDHVLLLEDFATAQVGDNVKGCSTEDAELAIRRIAKFHATWWESPQLAKINWIGAFNRNAERSQIAFQQRWDVFIEKFGDLLTDAFLDVGGKVGSRIAAIANQLAESPQTVVHGDLRLDNMLFDKSRASASLVVIDWQLISMGRGAYDFAYFLGFSLPSEQRRAMEMDLMRLYHSVLVNNGVRGYGFDQCLHDYRLSIPLLLRRLVVAGGTFDTTSERAQALLKALIQRTTSVITEHNVAELLSSL